MITVAGIVIIMFLGIVMMNIDTLLGLIVGGACTGMGSAVGQYFANRGLIKHLERIR